MHSLFCNLQKMLLETIQQTSTPQMLENNAKKTEQILYFAGIGKKKFSADSKSSTRIKGIQVMSCKSLLKKHRPFVFVVVILLLVTTLMISWPTCKISV